MARITVVNDYPEFLETMYAILDGDLGHEVAGFDGEEITLDDLVQSQPELLIVDLRLAGEDVKGWDILLMCRGDDTLREIPMIICSADVVTMRQRAAEFAEMGVFTLEKPFDVDTVGEVVGRALRARDHKLEATDDEDVAYAGGIAVHFYRQTEVVLAGLKPHFTLLDR